MKIDNYLYFKNILWQEIYDYEFVFDQFYEQLL